MDRPFDEELRELRKKLLHMAAQVEESIVLSVRSLKERKEELTREVLRNEDLINQFDLAIDEIGLRLLALRQPMAADLRFISSAMKIASDLERIGDLAVNIAERTLELIKSPLLKPLIDIPEMARLAQAMVKDALHAFVDKDESLARSVCERDDEVDNLNDQVFRELLTYMMGDRETIPRAMGLLLVSRHLERMADHATNIAEDVIYMVSGKIIKHHCGREPGGEGTSSGKVDPRV